MDADGLVPAVGCEVGSVTNPLTAGGSPSLDSLQVPPQCFEAVEVVHRQKVIHVRQGRLDSLGQRLVGGHAQERIQPDQSVAVALEALHLLAEDLDIAPIPAVADDHNDGPTAEDALTPGVVEGAQGLANAGAAGPVLHRAADLGEGNAGVARAQLTGNPGQASCKDERLDAVQAVFNCMEELEKGPTVAVHRAADIAQQNE